jgi:hypothetical protein
VPAPLAAGLGRRATTRVAPTNRSLQLWSKHTTRLHSDSPLTRWYNPANRENHFDKWQEACCRCGRVQLCRALSDISDSAPGSSATGSAEQGGAIRLAKLGRLNFYRLRSGRRIHARYDAWSRGQHFAACRSATAACLHRAVGHGAILVRLNVGRRDASRTFVYSLKTLKGIHSAN